MDRRTNRCPTACPHHPDDQCMGSYLCWQTVGVLTRRALKQFIPTIFMDADLIDRKETASFLITHGTHRVNDYARSAYNHDSSMEPYRPKKRRQTTRRNRVRQQLGSFQKSSVRWRHLFYHQERLLLLSQLLWLPREQKRSVQQLRPCEAGNTSHIGHGKSRAALLHCRPQRPQRHSALDGRA